MLPRRSLRLTAGALVLALPLLSSCGFDKATDRPYTPAEGTNDRTGDMKVLSAVVVSAQPGSGTFISTISNNTDDVSEDTSFDGLTAADDSDVTIEEFDPVDVPYRGFVNLADGDGVPVTGDFTPGNTLALSLTFSNGDTVDMDVPVVYACDEYTGLDFSAGAEPSSSSSPSESPSPGEVPTEESSESSSSEDSSSEDPSLEPTPSPGEVETSEASTTSEDSYDCSSVLGEE